MKSEVPDAAIRASLGRMGDLRLVELSASTIVAVNNMSLKPGQEEFLSPVSYGIAATVVNPQTTWQRVVLDGEQVVAFISGNFDLEDPQEHFRSVLWRINVDADDQGKGIGRFAVEGLIEEARNRGMDHVNVIYEAGEGGPQAFFERVGFTPVGETEYGEVIAEIRL
ncbi:diamine N-acetyltransferase [Microbacterium kyungheense]|uniref:Diamine N-acetyltransferase n=2 Tax=Microbacterium TaxID=33882 RepID=A0A543FKZ7_9MICO|nr:diamine N-acetyltransferase [Microbacterium kyungheense]